MDALRASIERDGFLAPIVVRRKQRRYEILSGNHRVMASRDAGLKEIPALLVEPCDDDRAARIAVNMNTVHGDPTPDLLAPFLAETSDAVLQTLFLGDDLLKSIVEFDETLQERLENLKLPDRFDSDSRGAKAIPNCICRKCGLRHVAARSNSK